MDTIFILLFIYLFVFINRSKIKFNGNDFVIAFNRNNFLTNYVIIFYIIIAAINIFKNFNKDTFNSVNFTVVFNTFRKFEN